MKKLKKKIVKTLRWSEKYTGTDMVYLIEGGFWENVYKVAKAILSLITMYAFGNWVSREAFGTYEFILSVVGALTIITLPGTLKPLKKAVAQKKEGTLKKVFKIRLKYSVAGTIILLFGSGYYYLQNNFELALSFLIVAILFGGYKTLTTYKSYWEGKKRFDMKAKYRVTARILTVAVILPTLYYTDNFIIIITAVFLSDIIFNAFFLRRTLSKTENEEVDKKTIPFGKKFTAIDAIRKITKKLDNVIIWYFLGAVPVAVYVFGYKPVEKAKSFIPLSTLALPKLSEKDIKKIKKPTKIKLLKSYLIIIPAMVAGVLLAPYVYEIFLPEYVESVPYFQVLMLLFLFIPLGVLRAALIVEMDEKGLFVTNLVSSVVRLSLFIGLIPFYGLWGIVAGVLASKTIESGFLYYYFNKI